MQQINGDKQIKIGTIPFANTDVNFASDVFQQKSVTDFVQINDITSTPGSGVIALSIATNLGNTITNTGNVTGVPSPSDMGFIASVDGDPKLGKSRCVVRDGSQDLPLLDGSGREIFGYLVQSGATAWVELYVWDGSSEVAAVVPAGVSLVDLQAMRRFYFSTVGEDFGANEKWAMGMVDTNTFLNIQQIVKDAFGVSYTLDNDGLADLGTSLQDQITNHLGDTTDAHAGSAISFASGTTGINASNVQTALEAIAAMGSAGVSSLQAEVDAVETAVGLNADGTFSAFVGTNYLDAATSIKNGMTTLDTVANAVSSALATHMAQATDAHDASAISFAPGVLGLGDDAQEAIESVNTKVVNHLAATWSDADAHDADQIEVLAYVASGTHALTNASLQDNLEDMVDRELATYLLIETHLSEDNAHVAQNIDVEISGTSLASHFPGYVASGTLNLQEFLYQFDQHVHTAITTSTSTSATEIARLEEIVGVTGGATDFATTSTTFLDSLTTIKSVAEKLDAEITHIFSALGAGTAESHARDYNTLANTGSQLSLTNTDSYALAIDTVRANVARHLAQATGAHAASAISYVSGTSLITADNTQDAFEDVANRLNRLETQWFTQNVTVGSNGSNQVFTLSYSVSGLVFVMLNGLVLTDGVDFTLAGDQLTVNGLTTTTDSLLVKAQKVVANIA